MTQKNQKQAKIKKKRSNVTILVFWVCLILVIIPFAILGWILFSSSLSTHTPVIGNRYEGDLDPAITSAQLETIKTNTASISGVEGSDVQLATGTLRVYADINDDANAEDATARANEIYESVSRTLDPTVYFTKSDTKKMYDLEIHVYTTTERTEEENNNFVYVIETKTSSMSEPASQVVSTARNEELAQQLRDDVEARKAAAAQAEAEDDEEGSITVGGTEVQEGSGSDTEEQPAE